VRSQLHDTVNRAFSCMIFDENTRVSIVMNGETAILSREDPQHNVTMKVILIIK
jgi:hypothetical protein